MAVRPEADLSVVGQEERDLETEHDPVGQGHGRLQI